MRAWLRGLGIAVIVLGLCAAGWAATLVARDVHFAEVRTSYERHPEHPLFQAEYYSAAVRHYGLMAGAVGSALGGVVFGSLLLGLGAVLDRVSRRP